MCTMLYNFSYQINAKLIFKKHYLVIYFMVIINIIKQQVLQWLCWLVQWNSVKLWHQIYVISGGRDETGSHANYVISHTQILTGHSQNRGPDSKIKQPTWLYRQQETRRKMAPMWWACKTATVWDTSCLACAASHTCSHRH